MSELPPPVDQRALDESYKSFPGFKDWSRQTEVDVQRWSKYLISPEKLQGASIPVLDRARMIATRAAAIDTGAIEGLYEVDRGFTLTVAIEATAWETQAALKGEQFRASFEAQLEAYEYVLDFATARKPMAEAWIRELHSVICANQSTYQVVTEIGIQPQTLLKGSYKVHPNHVRLRDGTSHAYCPVDLTPAEMARLVRELTSQAFQAAHPVQQAAYAHYALVAIHPFADGNGRVARALASAYTYRSQSVPLVILVEHRAEYYAALSAADIGNIQAFVEFTLARAIDSLQLVQTSIAAAQAPRVEDEIAEISGLYITKGGFTHDQVDVAGALMAKVLGDGVKEATARVTSDRVVWSVNVGGYISPAYPPGYRGPVRGGAFVVQVMADTQPPAEGRTVRHFAVALPVTSGEKDDLILWQVEGGDPVIFPLTGCLPTPSAVTTMRLRMFAEEIVGSMAAIARSVAAGSLRGKGY